MRMPGEFEPHERTVICWPTRDDLYPGARMAEARAAHAELAQTIARYEPTTMIAAPADAEHAAELCGASVEVVELPIDDSWFRDTGPIYVRDDTGQRRAVDFTFNGWGGKYDLPGDDTVGGAIARMADAAVLGEAPARDADELALLGLPGREAQVVLEDHGLLEAGGEPIRIHNW